MSGHSKFQAIGNDIGRMSVNFNVGNSQGVEGSQGVGGANREALDPRNNNLEPRNSTLETAKSLIRQLDGLLARAATSATKPLDAAALRTALPDVNISEAKRQAIAEAAEKAQSAFKAINAFTGRQLGEAVTAVNGAFDWKKAEPGSEKTAGDAVSEAIDAQADLADLLREAINEAHDARSAELLDEAVMQCDRRSCEIQALVCEFASLAEQGENASDEVKARLDATLEKLLPRMALEMHGNDAAIGAMKTEVEPLARRLDEISKSSGKSLSNREVEAIKREIDTMSNALGRAVASGQANGIAVDRTLFMAAKDVLTDVRSKISNVRAEVAKASMQHLVEKVFRPADNRLLDAEMLPFMKVVAPTLAATAGIRENLCKAAAEFVKSPGKDNLDRMNQLGEALAAADSTELNLDIKGLVEYTIDTVNVNGKTVSTMLDANAIVAKIKEDAENLPAEIREECNGPLVAEFAALLVELRENAAKKYADINDNPLVKIGNLFYPPSALATQVAQLELISKSAKSLSEIKLQTSDTVLAAFDGKVRFSTIVESRMRGQPEDDIDPKLDDANIESSRPLASGVANTVYEVTRKDGEKYVFKPEAPGRQALEKLYLTMGLHKSQMVAGLNMASQKTAEALGLEDVMAKTAVGAHKGDFGIFMEKVPGVETEVWKKAKNPDDLPAGQISPNQIKQLSDDEYGKIVGGLMRKANRLEWFDLITGQGDRHTRNYMIAVDAKTHTVSLKGIDNDACFPAYRKGLRTYHLDSDRTLKFQSKLESVFRMLYPSPKFDHRFASREASDLLISDPGIIQNPDGSLTVDATKEGSSPFVKVALMEAIGVQSTAMPDYIDKDLYDNLMTLATSVEMRRKFIADMKARLSGDAAAIALSRLDDAIAHAKKLAAEGKVVAKSDWDSHEMQRTIAGVVRRRGNDNHPKLPKVNNDDPDYEKKGELRVAAAHEFATSGYFIRDIVRDIAKDGWFDELNNE